MNGYRLASISGYCEAADNIRLQLLAGDKVIVNFPSIGVTQQQPISKLDNNDRFSADTTFDPTISPRLPFTQRPMMSLFSIMI
jgi:hypothetical protein